MTIKKAYLELVDLLEANKGKKVSSILNDVKAMCSARSQANTSITDKDGNVIAIFCYYHKQWELTKDVSYGKKASSSTGLNTMCKIGTSLWTKAQRVAKTETANILTRLQAEEIKPADIEGIKEDIEATRKLMDTTNMPQGFATEEEIQY